MKIEILTQFKEMFGPVLGGSILGRAAEKGLIETELIDIRDWSLDKHRKTDDAPFGGGAGMLMMPQPAFDALDSVGARKKRCIYMSPRGRVMDEELIRELAASDGFVLLCGHYEGVDQRILDAYGFEEVSIGDYVLTGGELPAMVLIDAVARLIPGVLGSSESLSEESIYSGLLEYDQYTKPREYAGMEVPEVLFGGNHRLIHLWQFECSLRITKERRPDLFERWLASHRELTKEEKRILHDVLSEA